MEIERFTSNDDIEFIPEDDLEDVLLVPKPNKTFSMESFVSDKKELASYLRHLDQDNELESIVYETTSSQSKIKVELLVKPIQSGKTKFLIDYGICKTFTSNNKNVISIIFCDNNLLLTTQTLSRINKEENIYRDDDGDKVLELSSKSKVKKTEIEHFVRNESVKIIVMCSNSVRLNDITWFLQQRSVKNDFRFEIWIDEADKFAKPIDSFVKQWSNFGNVKKITMMTATPEKVFHSIENVSVIPLDSNEICSTDKYLSFRECRFDMINETCSGLEYIKTVFKEHTPQNGQFWFIPAGTKKTSHNEVKTLLQSFGFVVLVINSDGKMYYSSNQGSKPILNYFSEDERKEMTKKEVKDWLPDFYFRMELTNQKFAITGNISIGRGITIQSRRLMITHCICPPKIRDKSTAYQMLRILGMIKDFPNLIVPTVYCTSKFREEMNGMEHAAMKLAKLAQENPDMNPGLEYKKLTKEGSRSCDCKVEVVIFDTVEQMKDKIKQIFGSKSRPQSNFVQDEDSGKLKCCIRKITKVFSLKEVLDDKGWGLNKCVSSCPNFKNKQKIKYRQHVGYDGDIPKFVLCYTKP